MRNALSLRTRFLVGGAFLTIISGTTSLYSAWAFSRVQDVVDHTVQEGEEATGVTGALINALEREDDALLKTALDKDRGRRALENSRAAVGEAFKAFQGLLARSDRAGMASHLKADIAGFNVAGDKLLAAHRPEDARTIYEVEVNPLLRRAVGKVADVREAYFRATENVATWARDWARRSTQLLLGVSLAALLLSIIVGIYLARVVIRPIRQLTDAVGAMRRGEFDFKVWIDHHDEIGRLAEGFNLMADDLAIFRRANIGEVMRAKETLQAALAALPDAVIIVEAGGAISSANPRATEIIDGVATAKTRLQELLLPSATKAAIEASLRGELARARSVDFTDMIAMRVGKEERRLLPRIVPIHRGAAHKNGAVLVLSDLTEIARLDEMRMELVAVASHELRTPLTTLKMTLLMLKERAEHLDDHERALVGTALFGAEQLSSTVAKFLDLTQIEAGQLRLQRAKVDVQTLLAEAMRAVEPACKEGGIELVTKSGPDVPGSVWGDAGRLSVVLSNVLINAIKYTPVGGRIEIVARPDDVAGEPHLDIEVTDSGPGVDPEFRERVFEKFFRVEHHHAAGEQGARGSGIGLYIAREIVRAHGGTISCLAGPEEKGARFIVTLPVADRPN
ncbi:MAG TPA: ATP-binding protein [Polyangia bacterium]|nr:ATP-binding protein [Polyangia bacterium]